MAQPTARKKNHNITYTQAVVISLGSNRNGDCL